MDLDYKAWRDDTVSPRDPASLLEDRKQPWLAEDRAGDWIMQVGLNPGVPSLAAHTDKSSENE